jgi:hypothetical protein
MANNRSQRAMRRLKARQENWKPVAAGKYEKGWHKPGSQNYKK